MYSRQSARSSTPAPRHSRGTRLARAAVAANPRLQHLSAALAAAPPAFGLGYGGRGLVAIQRLKQAGEFYDARAQNTPVAQVADLQAIRDRLGDYHALNDGNDANFQRRLHALRELDTAIYRWFDAHVQGAIADTPNGHLLLTLQRESEAEHRSLIGALLQRNDTALLPIDATGVGVDDQAEAQELWNRIVASKGNLQIQEGESPAVQLQMLAAMAKLLQGGHGRRLIGDLSRGNVPITLGSTFAQLTDPQLQAGGNKAIPLQDLVDYSKNYEFREVEQEEAGDFREYTGGANPHAFNEFLQGLDRDYFKVGDKYFQRGTRQGSLVRITRPESGPLVGATNVAHQYREVVTPNFVTIGHELGHARRIAKGLALPPSTHLPPEQIGMPADQTTADMWTRAEELVNISSDENQIRDEHGVTRRIFHRGSLPNVQGTLNQARFNQAQSQIQDTLGEEGKNQLRAIIWFQNLLDDAFMTQTNDWATPTVFQGMMNRLPNLRLVVDALRPLEQANLLPVQIYGAADAATQAVMEADEGYQGLLNRFLNLQPNAFASEARDAALALRARAIRAAFEADVAKAKATLGSAGQQALTACRSLEGEVGRTTLATIPRLRRTVEQTADIIRGLEAAQRLPEQIYAGISRAARLKLDTDERFTALRRRFNDLLLHANAADFVGGARAVAADLKSRGVTLIAEAAAEETGAGKPSLFSFFGLF